MFMMCGWEIILTLVEKYQRFTHTCTCIIRDSSPWPLWCRCGDLGQLSFDASQTISYIWSYSDAELWSHSHLNGFKAWMSHCSSIYGINVNAKTCLEKFATLSVHFHTFLKNFAHFDRLLLSGLALLLCFFLLDMQRMRRKMNKS